MYLPNESLLYNTEDSKLYGVKNLTFINDRDEIETRPEREWIPNEVPLGDYTFNLVGKIFMFGYRPPYMVPTEFEDVTQFATNSTSQALHLKISKVLPKHIKLVIVGKVDNPKDWRDRVYFEASDDKGKIENAGVVGELAVFEMQNGTKVMLDHFVAGLRSTGFSI